MRDPARVPKSAIQRILDVVEKVGNKVPHPAVELVHTVKEHVHLPEFANGCRLAVALATREG